MNVMEYMNVIMIAPMWMDLICAHVILAMSYSLITRLVKVLL